MQIAFYLLVHVVTVLACVYWARANGHSVVLWGLVAGALGPLALLILLGMKLQAQSRHRARPALAVRPPTPSNATFSAAAGPLGGYGAPGEEPPAPVKQLPLYLPLVLNGAGLLGLLMLCWGDEGKFLLLAVPLFILGNGVFFLHAFAKRANGPALLCLLLAVAGIWFVMQTLESLGHR